MGLQCSKCQIDNENELILSNLVPEYKHNRYMEDLEDSFEIDPNYPPSTTINKTMEEKSIQFSKMQKESQHTIQLEYYKLEELQMNDDSKYFGQIKDGQANGNGKLWLKNGDYYEGEFLNNLMHGKGIYNTKNGPIYEGQFLFNKLDGFGFESWPDGSLYEGYFKEGKKYGKGCYKCESQKTKFSKINYKLNKKNVNNYQVKKLQLIINPFFKNLMNIFNNLQINSLQINQYFRFKLKQQSNKKYNIKVVFTLENGRIIKFMELEDMIGLMEGYVDRQQFQSYSGSWVFNQMHGRGKYIWQDGKCYDGEYQNDRKQGFGIFYWPDCKQYQGQWKDGKQHGKGIMIYPDGKKKVGIWQNGKLINYTEEDNFQIIPENWLQQ